MENNWVFLRGLTRGNIHWGDFSEIFARENPEAKVEYLEIPGNGNLFCEVTPTRPEDVISLLRKRSKFVTSASKFNLCGISLGGMLALKWTELYPDEVASVFVINSSLSQFSVFYRRLRPLNYVDLSRAIFEKDSYAQEKAILKMTSNNFAENERYLALFADFSKTHSVSYANFLRQLLLAKNVRVKNLHNKKLTVLSSSKDRLVHSDCSIEIAKHLGGSLIIHPTCGHDLPLDDPHWVVKQLKKIMIQI